jgi:hypothetical protein
MDYARQVDCALSKNTENVALEKRVAAAVDAILSAWPGPRFMETTQPTREKKCRSHGAAYENTHP